MHGSQIYWEGLEQNLSNFGHVPPDHSTRDVIDPLSLSEFEFERNKPSDVVMEFDKFSKKLSSIFEYKLFEIYTNGFINNHIITETSTTVPSEFILPEYPGMFLCFRN